MSFALLGIILVVALLALVAIFMSSKNWHWAQMLLVLGVFLLALVSLLLSTEVLRIHKALRANIEKTEQQVQQLAKANDALRYGTNDAALIGSLFDESPFDESIEQMPGIEELNHQLQISARRLGRMWQGVTPAGVQNGKIAINIPAGQPVLKQEAIVYAFEIGPPSGSNPQQGAQYLGEFKVTAAEAETAQLQPVRQMTERTVRRLTASQKPWRLYETMPADRHDLFQELANEQLQALLPSSSVEQYLKHGEPATDDDDPRYIVGFDEDGNRVRRDDLASAPDKRYSRPLRAYAFLFEEFARQRTLTLADGRATAEDTRKLQETLASAKQLTAYREQEKQALALDLAGMARDRDAINKLLAEVTRQFENAERLLRQALDANAELANELNRRQVGRLQAFDLGSAIPSVSPLLSP